MTKIPRNVKGKEPIPQGTLRAILRQAELTVDQLIEAL